MVEAKILPRWLRIAAFLVLAAGECSCAKKAGDAAPPPQTEGLSATAQGRSPAPGGLQRLKRATIPNGEEAEQKDFPFAVALGPNSTTKLCGGTVVSPGWVLTAAHCRRNLMAVGRVFQASGSTQVQGTVSKRYCPPTFDEPSSKHDIALLQASGNGFTSLARVTLVPNDTWDREGELVTLIGWGLTGSGFPTTLMKGDVKIHSRPLCEQEYAQLPQFAFDGETFCTDRSTPLPATTSGTPAATPSADSGDSGGPVLVEVNGVLVQGGVISVGEGNTLPDRHIKLTEPFRKWIQDVINDKPTIRQNSACSHP